MAFTPTKGFFTDREAWNVFRLAAFGEAIGWTLLIAGIIYRHFGLPNGSVVLKVLGQTHGMLFFAYFAALMAVAGSLRLTRLQFMTAAVMSIPPYGTLVYEKFLAYKRRQNAVMTHREIVVRAIIRDAKKLLAVQPKRGTFWCVPGGTVGADETPEQALLRLLHEQFGVQLAIGNLYSIYHYRHHGQLRLELFYQVSSQSDLQLTSQGRQEYDEVAWIKPEQTPDLRPELLRRRDLVL